MTMGPGAIYRGLTDTVRDPFSTGTAGLPEATSTQVVDYTQELGMYGNIIVVPTEPEYWAPVNRELVLVLDDILLTGDQVAPFSKAESNRTAMGRYGNVMLVNGQTEYCMQVRRGEVVRLYLTNTANVRPFNFRIPGARMKLVGGDGGRIECEAFVSEVLIAPSERVIVDVLFAEPGQLRMEHAGPEQSYMLGSVTAHDWPVEQSYTRQFSNLRTNPEFAPERAGLQGNWSVHPTRPSGLSRSCRA